MSLRSRDEAAAFIIYYIKEFILTFANIFDVPKGTGSTPVTDTVGRFRSGHQLNKRPIALTNWRVTTDDPGVAGDIARLFGGEKQEWDSEREPYEVFTTVPSVEVLVEPNAIHTGMVLYGRAGAIRRCDGETMTYPAESKGQPCACASFSSLADRKAAAANGTGCSPEIIIRFRLANEPDLGEFKFVTGSWSMARDIVQVEAALRACEGTQKATLSLEHVEFTTKEGQKRSFTKPVLALKGSA